MTKEDIKDEAVGGVRGFMRAYMRKLVKNLSLGSLPLQHHTKSIQKTIGSVNQVLDVSHALSEAEGDKTKLSYVQRLKGAAPSHKKLPAWEFAVRCIRCCGWQGEHRAQPEGGLPCHSLVFLCWACQWYNSRFGSPGLGGSYRLNQGQQ